MVMCHSLRYNLRKFDRLPVHLQLAGRHSELSSEVLFNFDWIYHKSIACSYDSVIDDYRRSTKPDARLVEVALRQSKSFVGDGLRNIGIELTGRLLPYIGVHQTICQLISDCDRRGLKLSAVVPNFPYRQPPGGPLQHTVQLPSVHCANHVVAQEHDEGAGMRFACVSRAGSRHLVLAKDPSQSEVYVIDPLTGCRKSDLNTSLGLMHVTTSGRIAVIVNYEREKSVKIHCLEDLDDPLASSHGRNTSTKATASHCDKFNSRNGFSQITNGRASSSRKPSGISRSDTDVSSLSARSRFLGHIVPTRHIELSSRDRQRLTQVHLIGDTHVILSVESLSDSRTWLVVGDLTSCSVVHTTQYRGRVTCCQSWQPETCGVVFVGVEQMLYTYQLVPDVRLIGETKLPDMIQLITFTKVSPQCDHCRHHGAYKTRS